MHEKQLEAFTRKILDITNSLLIRPPFGQPWPEDTKGCAFYHGHVYDISFTYDFSTEDLIRDLVAEIRKKTHQGNKLSESYIRESMTSLFRTLLKTQDSTRRAASVADFFSQLPRAIERQIVFVPLHGIELKAGYWDVGRVRIMEVDRNKLRTMLPAFPDFAWKQMPQSAAEGPYAVFESDAEAKHAKELAYIEARRAVDLLRFAATLSPPPIGRYFITLEEEFNPKDENRHTCVFSAESVALSLSWGAAARRNDGIEQLIWPLTRDTIEELNQIALHKLSALLKKDYAEVNDFDKRVLRAVHWIANAQIQIEEENRLLNLTTALETLFTQKDGTPIANSIAEAVAFITARDLEERVATKKRVKNLYDLRSKISHGGHTVVGKTGIRDLSTYCRAVSLWAINKIGEFKAHSDIFNWIENQKFESAT